MQVERWQRIDEIFQAALDCAPENRAAFLDSACGTDSELRHEVESLLASHEKSSFTESVAFQDAVKVLEERAGQVEKGHRIGPYRVLREIGRGGMGSVYLAARDDEAFQKLVAIKIIRRGLDTDDIIRRFRSERQVLATLEHPNITRLLDGGTTDDGLPYFAMEYIEGEPLDQYCDARKLNISERLKLFQSVCSAVRYAHQHLIVHRDIKPGNVLVTKDGVPRLLDFGIAKLLAPGATTEGATFTRLHPLTPEYASPEQVRSEGVTTASDVYSLGVMLYVLLTGRRPYRTMATSQAEMERAICEEIPERPSVVVMREGVTTGEKGPRITSDSVSRTREGTADKLRRRLRGDLDNIVLMALRKEPQRRYASAEQFSEDIRRHLENLPVLARGESPGYRTAKFIRRHRVGFAAGVLIFVSLTGGIAATLREAHIARQQRDRARVERIKAERLNVFLEDLLGFTQGRFFTGNNPKGQKATLADVLDDAASRVETELADEPEVQAEMQRQIGDIYANQSKLDLAERHLQSALSLDMKIYGPNRQETARTQDSLGVVHTYRGDYAGGEKFFRAALATYRKLPKDQGFDTEWYVVTMQNLALLLRTEGHYEEAESLAREGLTQGARLTGRAYVPVILIRYQLGALRADRGDLVEAESLARQAVQEFERIGYQQSEVWAARLYLANILRDEGKYAEAEAFFQSTSPGLTQYGTNQEKNGSFGYALMNLAYLHCLEGHYTQAEQEATHALKVFQGIYPQGHPWRAGALTILGMILNQTGRANQAEPPLREALDTRIRLLGKSHFQTAFTQDALGECLMIQKRYEEAEPLLIEAYSTLKKVQKEGSPLAIEAARKLRTLYLAWGKPPEAARYQALVP